MYVTRGEGETITSYYWMVFEKLLALDLALTLE